MSDRFLHPGCYLFGHLPIRVQTVLGSCVALCAWHPQRRLLAISHAIQPHAPVDACGRDMRYADRVLQRLRADMLAAGTLPQEYRYGLFGGSCQLFDAAGSGRGVGAQNLQVFRAGLEPLRGSLDYSEDTGGDRHRRLLVDGRRGGFSVVLLEPLPRLDRESAR
jgi:chemotaxis protein CheD